MVRVWIDTDIGDNPDDAIALLVAAAHPGVELVGVSTVRGDVVHRAQLAGDLLAAAGASVPLIYAGPPDPRAVATAEAVLAIGPLTNIAALLSAGHELPPTALMGGVFEPTVHRGATRECETNFESDRFAAGFVIAKAVDLLVVPLDVTAAMVLDATQVERLMTLTALHESLGSWTSTGQDLCLHDPLALLALLGEHVQVARRSIGVTVEGRTVVDDRDGAQHDVVVQADHAAAKRRTVDLAMTWGD